jgi:hypothetical protein
MWMADGDVRGVLQKTSGGMQDILPEQRWTRASAVNFYTQPVAVGDRAAICERKDKWHLTVLNALETLSKFADKGTAK